MTGAVVEDDTLDELGVGRHAVLHGHNLHHEQIDGLALAADGKDGIGCDLGELIGNLAGELRAQRGARHAEKQLALRSLLLLLELLEELERAGLGQVEALGQDARVHTVVQVALALLQQLANQKHVRGGAIASDVILSRGRARNERSGGVLDLLNPSVSPLNSDERRNEMGRTISCRSTLPSLVSLISPAPPTSLREVSIRRAAQASAASAHLDSALRPKIGTQDLLQTLGGVDVEYQRMLLLRGALGLGVDELQGHGDGFGAHCQRHKTSLA